MFILVAGPDQINWDRHPGITTDQLMQANSENARIAHEVALELMQNGHTPLTGAMNLVNHRITFLNEMSVAHEERVRSEWVQRCDALFIVGTANDALLERQIAGRLGKPVYENIAEVPVPDLDRWNP